MMFYVLRLLIMLSVDIGDQERVFVFSLAQRVAVLARPRPMSANVGLSLTRSAVVCYTVYTLTTLSRTSAGNS